MTDGDKYGGIERILSGGQTGVDRAALDVAIELGIPHGGWCPRGRRAEDGAIADRYQLQETSSPLYHVRTERNVVESQGTLILFRAPLVGGSKLTRDLAQRHRRPCLLIDISQATAAEAQIDEIRCWLDQKAVAALNVAGPRESTNPGIFEQAAEFLRKLLRFDRETL